MEYQKTYAYKGKEYLVLIQVKRVRNYNLRYNRRSGSFRMSVPYVHSKAKINEMISAFVPTMVDKYEDKPAPKPYGDGWMYLLGEKIEFDTSSPNAMKKEKRKALGKHLETSVRKYESIMGVDIPYNIRIRDMRTRYGVNSKRTHTLTFQEDLAHFPPDVIDSVVVHEIAHHFVFDHSPSFYKVVYHYCPDYKSLHARLRKSQYER